MQLYNVLFTALPIIIFGVTDLEFDKELLVHNPHLYQDGLINDLFSKKIFWRWLMFAAIQGSIIFFSIFTTMKNATEVYGLKSEKG